MTVLLIGKIELVIQVWARDDCAEGTLFYRSYIDSTKLSAPSGWTNWFDPVLGRACWSIRANSIGQTVQGNWCSVSETNAAKICNSFKEENAEVTINADRTWVKFFMEEGQVVAPTGTKRVGGRIETEVKKGFTLMVGCNLETSLMEDPFVVFDGTKLCKAKQPERTLAWKCRNWCSSVAGKTR